MRAVIYARYSDPRQNPSSIRDQIEVCRGLIAGEDYAELDIYSDAAISGAAAGNRPGFLKLMADAQAGKFDVVVVEALDRFSRGMADVAGAFEDLTAAGVILHTVAEGIVGELHIGLKGTMNALFLKDLGAKTYRGLAGVINEGRAISTPYGYKVVRKIGADGEVQVGLREIDETKRAVVVRIFDDYVAGVSPQKICSALNAEGVPSSAGGSWLASRLTTKIKGMLYNETYRGVIVWGRTVMRKNRATGARRAFEAPAERLIRIERPDLRIISDEVWFKAQERLAANSVKAASHGHSKRRPKRLLSGIIFCSQCNSTMTLSAGEATPGARAARFRCNGRLQRGPGFCTNGGTVPMVDAEQRVIAAIRDRLLRPEAIDAVVREIHRLTAERAKTAGADRGRLERELADTRRKAERLVDQVAEGVLSGATVAGKIREFEGRAATLEYQLRELAAAGNVVAIHPAAADHYRRLVDNLSTQLDGDGAAEVQAREAFRKLIGAVRMIPGEKRGQYELEIVGRIQDVMTFIAGRQVGDPSEDQAVAEFRIRG